MRDKPTVEQIKAEAPGPRKDAWVAKHVMRWKCLLYVRRGKTPSFCIIADDVVVARGNGLEGWSPTTDISAAWEVVEKLKSREFCLAYLPETDEWDCAFRKGACRDENRLTVYAKTAPDAICTAALLCCLEKENGNKGSEGLE